MRLQDTEREVIKQTICCADPDATVYLFGSRKDITAKEGGIDLWSSPRKLT